MNEAWAVVIGALVGASVGLSTTVFALRQASKQRREDRRREKVKWLQEVAARMVECFGEAKASETSNAPQDLRRVRRANFQFAAWGLLVGQSRIGDRIKSLGQPEDGDSLDADKIMEAVFVALGEAIEETMADKN